RLAQILLGFAAPLAVERAEIEPDQRDTEDSSCRARREALAATLYAQEQDTLGGIQLGRTSVEGGLAACQPGTQVLHSRDVSKLRGVRLVGQGAAAVEQLILSGQHTLQVRHRERAVIEDCLPAKA